MRACLCILVALLGLLASAQATFTCPPSYPIGPRKYPTYCRSRCPSDPYKCLKGICYPKTFGYGKKCWSCTQKILSYIDGYKCCSNNIKCPSVPPKSCYKYACLPASYGFYSCQKVVNDVYLKSVLPLTTSGVPVTTCCDPSKPDSDYCPSGKYCDDYSFTCK